MSPVDERHWFDAEVVPCEPSLRAYLHNRFPALHDHDDIVQEAYVRLLHAKREGKLTCTKAFLFTVARNLAIDMFRRRKRTATHEPISELAELPVLEGPSDISASIERQQRIEVLFDAVLSLPERCREVVMLRHMDGMSYKEVAEHLGISPNTVKVHLVKGVSDCTTFMRKRGLFEATGTLEPITLTENPTR